MYECKSVTIIWLAKHKKYIRCSYIVCLHSFKYFYSSFSKRSTLQSWTCAVIESQQHCWFKGGLPWFCGRLWGVPPRQEGANRDYIWGPLFDLWRVHDRNQDVLVLSPRPNKCSRAKKLQKLQLTFNLTIKQRWT